MGKKQYFTYGSKLTGLQRRYCSCLMKVRGDLVKSGKILTRKKKPQNKKTTKLMSDKAHYGICYGSIRKQMKMNKNKKTKRQFHQMLHPRSTNCIMNYDFNDYTLQQVQSLSKEMRIPITYKRKNRRRKFYKKSTLVKRLTTRYLNSVKNGKYNKRK